MKRVLKWCWTIIEVLIIVYVIFITSCILCRNKYGYTQYDKYVFVTVNEDNVKHLKSYDIGDLIIIKNQKFGIDKGDVIYYYYPLDERYLIKSDVVSSKMEDDYSALYTLNDEDATTIASNRVLGKYTSVYKGMGSVLDFLVGRVGFLLFVLLPIMVVFIYRIYDLVVVSKYEIDEEISATLKNITEEDTGNIEVL